MFAGTDVVDTWTKTRSYGNDPAWLWQQRLKRCNTRKKEIYSDKSTVLITDNCL